ncbi:MAG: DUF2515 family protein [Bacilli bacterium]
MWFPLVMARRAASFCATAWIRIRRKWRRKSASWAEERVIASFAEQLGACLEHSGKRCETLSAVPGRTSARTGDVGEGAPARLDVDRLRTDISQETSRHNRNNLTRTEAYRRIYSETPELHWALLAHLVSRNGGWNMTDLCGDLGSSLTAVDKQALFFFLEHCNYLIFQDVYPQLRIYQESSNCGQPLFALCSDFGVSRFMQVAWMRFWNSGNRQELTVALIINEQSHIEQHVVQDPAVRKAVFERPAFNAQSLFHMTAVLFPVYGMPLAGRRFYGNFVRDFTSLEERIDVGKMLYALLFARRNRPRRRFLRFVERVRHTGSRADYAPDLFAETEPGRADRLYSPALAAAWPDQEPPSVSSGDWCVNTDAVRYLQKASRSRGANITRTYLRTLAALRMIVN